MLMFPRRQRLRHFWGKGFRNKSIESIANVQKSVHHKKRANKRRRDSFRQTRRDRKEDGKSRLQRCMDSIAKRWNSPSIEYDKNRNCKITTPEGRFELIVSGLTSRKTKETPAVSLSISTCVYTCTSDVQSTAVVKKATEMNDFVEEYGNQDYALQIFPMPSSSSTPPQLCAKPLPIKIVLYFSRPMDSFFNSDLKNNSTNGNFADKLFPIITNFVKVATNVQTKLERVDEGRLGMTPQQRNPKDDMSINTSHIEFLTHPPSIVARFMTAAVNTTTYTTTLPKSSADSSIVIDPSNQNLLSATMDASPYTCPRRGPSRGRSLSRIGSTAGGVQSKPNSQIHKSSRKFHSKSARNILSQFSTPEEARVFELYTRQKSKRKAVRRHSRIDKQPPASSSRMTETSVATDSSDESATFATLSGQTPKRTASLPITNGNQNPGIATKGIAVSALPQPPEVADWNKTPIISNKDLASIHREAHSIIEPII